MSFFLHKRERERERREEKRKRREREEKEKRKREKRREGKKRKVKKRFCEALEPLHFFPLLGVRLKGRPRGLHVSSWRFSCLWSVLKVSVMSERKRRVSLGKKYVACTKLGSTEC